MKIFDLHCDTIEALKKHNETFDNSTTQFTMKGQENLEKAVQFLAVWLPDHLRGQEAVDFTNGYYEYMTEAVGKVADRAALVEDMSDLDRILKEGKWAFNRSIESCAALGGKLENVYVFAKLNFKGRDRIFTLYLATMMIPFHVTVITNFLQMSMYGLVNTLWSLMLPASVSAFGTFLMRQFFVTVPNELIEAAKIDGCNPFKTFLQICFPMAKPTIATLSIFCFMNVWNDYFTPLIYINDSRKYTLPLGLASMKGMYSTDWPVLMASSVISVLPVLIAFLFAQDAFVKGVMMTGMKE